MCLEYKSFENTGKGEMARNDKFLLFPQFSLVWRTFSIFIRFEIVVSKLFQFERIKYFSFVNELNLYHIMTS